MEEPATSKHRRCSSLPEKAYRSTPNTQLIVYTYCNAAGFKSTSIFLYSCLHMNDYAVWYCRVSMTLFMYGIYAFSMLEHSMLPVTCKKSLPEGQTLGVMGCAEYAVYSSIRAKPS